MIPMAGGLGDTLGRDPPPMPAPPPPRRPAPPPPFEVRPLASAGDWRRAKAIRRRVFVEEQDCPPAEEFDGLDPACRHVLGWLGGEAIATARWREVPWAGGRAAKLERFAVLPEHRGRGHGRALVAQVIAEARAAGFAVLVLHAQAHLESFYAGFGFERRGEPFVEAGIPHVRMVRREQGRTGDRGGRR
jgi:predicted GNAT family N-acyltransferase